MGCESHVNNRRPSCRLGSSRRDAIREAASILTIVAARLALVVLRLPVAYKHNQCESFSEWVFLWSYRYAYFAPLEACLSTLCVLLFLKEVRQCCGGKKIPTTGRFLGGVLPLLIAVSYSCYWAWVEHPRIVDKHYRYMILNRPNYAPWSTGGRLDNCK
jgi:hypothetical protein